MKMSRSLKAVNSDWRVTPEEKVIKKTNTVFTGGDKEEQVTFQGSKFSSGSLKQASPSNRKCPQKINSQKCQRLVTFTSGQSEAARRQKTNSSSFHGSKMKAGFCGETQVLTQVNRKSQSTQDSHFPEIIRTY